MLSHLRAHIHKRDELVCNAGSKQASSGNQEISEYPSAPGILSCCLIDNQPVYSLPRSVTSDFKACSLFLQSV